MATKAEITTPREAALNVICQSVESLQQDIATLLPNSITTLLTNKGIEHIDNLIAIDNKTKQIKRMETNTEYTPTSARIKFVLNPSARVKETEAFARLKKKKAIISFQECKKH